MSGTIGEFFADLREAWQDERGARRRARQARSDPLVDLRTLPPEILRPIRPWVDDCLTAPQSERRIEFLGVEFTLRRGPRGPLVRYSELMAVYAKFTELSAVSERTAKQQVAEIEAETGLAAAKGHTDNLKARLARATEAQTAAELRLDTTRAEIASLKQHVTSLTADRDALRAELSQAKHRVASGLSDQERARFAEQVHNLMAQAAALAAEKTAVDQRAADIARSRDILVSQVHQMTADRQAHLASIANLRHEIAQLHAAREARAEMETEIVVTAKKILADNDALENEVKRLVADRESWEGERVVLAKKVSELRKDMDDFICRHEIVPIQARQSQPNLRKRNVKS